MSRTITTKRVIQAAGLTTVVAVLSACQGGAVGDRTKAGAALGAGLGLISGLTTNDSGEGTLIRTGVGAAIGAGIGAALDAQARDLEEDLSGSGAVIQNTGSELIVTLPEAITFDTARWDVRPALQDDLAALAGNLQQYPDTTVQVIGHTDNVGSDSYNQGLSERRANAVSSILISNGVPSTRIRAFGVGESQPKADNSSDFGRSQNRRVEVIITPNA